MGIPGNSKEKLCVPHRSTLNRRVRLSKILQVIKNMDNCCIHSSDTLYCLSVPQVMGILHFTYGKYIGARMNKLD